MKTRVVFGVVGFIFVLLALYVFPPIVLEIMIAALCMLATYELLSSTKLVRNRLVLILSMAMSLALAISHSHYFAAQLNIIVPILIFVCFLLSFLTLLRFHESMKASEVVWGFFGGLVLPYFMLSLLRIFQMTAHQGQFLVLLPLLAAWGADTSALFAGMFFGKRKLAPIVSPKKTVEGAIGGVLGGTVLVLLAALLLNAVLDLEFPIWGAVLLGICGAVIGVIGDLSFSIIKRQNKIKDYGSIFPGHGGVLDRFDSVLFVAPFAEILFRIIW